MPARRPRRAWCWFAIVLFGAATLVAETPNLTGRWNGVIELPGQQLIIGVDLRHDGETWTGTIDIPAQGQEGVPLADVVIDGTSVGFAIDMPAVAGAPRFAGQWADGSIDGRFRQGPLNVPFSLGREQVAGPRRPQTPAPPFPYRSEEVQYRGAGVTLAGTLTLPAGEGPFPAALLLTGSGPQDRDETLFDHRPFAVIADHLSRHGVAVLRVDDRGVGGSEGVLLDTTLDVMADDALAGIAFLAARPEIAADRIGLIGHSEGGIVAPIAARRSDTVAFVVMLAGTGVDGLEVLTHQTALGMRASGLPEVLIDKRVALLREAATVCDSDLDAAGRQDQIRPLMRTLLGLSETQADPPVLAPLLAERTSTWFCSFLAHDPADALSQVEVPVLALIGAKDLQVEAGQNLPPIIAALDQAGNRDVTASRLPDLNHLFQHAETGLAHEYATIEETIAPTVLERMSTWIDARFGAER